MIFGQRDEQRLVLVLLRPVDLHPDVVRVDAATARRRFAAMKRSMMWHHAHHSPPTSTITRLPCALASGNGRARRPSRHRAPDRTSPAAAGRSAQNATKQQRRRRARDEDQPMVHRVTGSAGSSMTIGSMTASTSTSTIAPMHDDQRRLHQRGEPGEAALGFALELVGRALEHRRERPLCSPLATRWTSTGGNTFCSFSARDSETPSRTSAAALRRGRARAAASARRPRAASSERSSGAPLPTRIASVLAKRAVSRLRSSRPIAGDAQQAAHASARETRRAGSATAKRDAAATTSAEPQPCRSRERTRSSRSAPA